MAVKASATVTLSSVRDLQSCTRYYLLRSSTLSPPAKPTANPPGGGWVTAEPGYTAGSTNSLYLCDLNVFSDGDFAWSEVSLSSSYEAAKAAYNEARAAQAAVAALDSGLDQQGVFDRLTDNGRAEGLYMEDDRLYVNASYIKTGTLTLGGANDQAGKLEVYDANGNQVGRWDKQGIVAKMGTIGGFNITSNSLSYGTIGQGTTGATIDRFGVEYSYYNSSSGETNGAWLTQGLVRLIRYGLGSVRLMIYPTYGGLRIGLEDSNNTIRYPLDIINDAGDRRAVFATAYRVQVNGNFAVGGTKSRLVSTDQYSDRLLYSYETPSPMFGDVGEGVIGEDGRCYVWLDPVFAQVISTDGYQVFLQRYGKDDCWVSERRGSHFIVEGAPGLRFGWEVKAKQADFDQRRLDSAELPFTAPEQGYGAQAARHIEELEKGRTEL